jgi:hypothetical protein
LIPRNLDHGAGASVRVVRLCEATASNKPISGDGPNVRSCAIGRRVTGTAFQREEFYECGSFRRGVGPVGHSAVDPSSFNITRRSLATVSESSEARYVTAHAFSSNAYIASRCAARWARGAQRPRRRSPWRGTHGARIRTSRQYHRRLGWPWRSTRNSGSGVTDSTASKRRLIRPRGDIIRFASNISVRNPYLSRRPRRASLQNERRTTSSGNSMRILNRFALRCRTVGLCDSPGIWLLCGDGCLFVASQISAQTPRQLRPDPLLDCPAGEWVLDGRIAGRATIHDVRARWVLNSEYLEVREVSRERAADGQLSYDAIIYLVRDPRNRVYTALWLDHTDFSPFSPTGGTTDWPPGTQSLSYSRRRRPATSSRRSSTTASRMCGSGTSTMRSMGLEAPSRA